MPPKQKAATKKKKAPAVKTKGKGNGRSGPNAKDTANAVPPATAAQQSYLPPMDSGAGSPLTDDEEDMGGIRSHNDT